MAALKAILTALIAGCVAVLITTAAMPKVLGFYDRSAWLALWTVLIIFFVVVRVGIGEIGFGRFMRHAKQKAGEKSAHELEHNKNHDNIDAYAQAAREQFRTRFAKEALKPLLSAILDPLGSTIRVSEQLHVERGVLRVTTAKTVYIDSAQGEQIFPILRVGKSALVDRLEVVVDDKPAKTLTHIETLGAILSILDVLYMKLFGHIPSSDPDAKAFAKVYAMVCDSTPRTPPEIEELLKTVANLRGKTAISDTNVHLVALIALIRFLGESSFILVSVPASSGSRVRLRVKYHQRQRKFYRAIRDRFRVACGLEIRSYYLPMQAAVEAPSYHLVAEAPEGMYLYDARFHLNLLKSRWRATVDHGIQRPQAPREEISDTFGLGYVHVYVRDIQGRLSALLDPSGETNVSDQQVALGLDVEFREIPPGLLLPILIFSTLFLALTLLLGHFHDDVFAASAVPTSTSSASPSPTATPTVNVSSTVTPSRSAVPQQPIRTPQPATSSTATPGASSASTPATALANLTVLFGIPALLAGWVISRLDSATIRRISLTTALLTFWFILNTGAAVFLVGFKGIQHHPTTVPFGVGKVSHVSWAALSLSATANTTAVIVVLLNRTIRYIRRLHKGRSVIAA